MRNRMACSILEVPIKMAPMIQAIVAPNIGMMAVTVVKNAIVIAYGNWNMTKEMNIITPNIKHSKH